MARGASKSWVHCMDSCRELGPLAKLRVAIMSGFCQTQTSGISMLEEQC
jgi:hypothetical protein